MTKHEFLNRFSNELNRRGVADAEDIVEEYAQHFAFKQADGYSEEEIAAKLGDPAQLAAQFEQSAAEQSVRGKKAAVVTGLCFLDIVSGLAFIALAAFGVVLAVAALAFAAAGVCLIGELNPYGLIPAMPYASALVFALALLALCALTACGCIWYIAFLRQSVRAFCRFQSNALANANGRAALPALPMQPQLDRRCARRLRRIARVSLMLFAVLSIAGFALSAILAGAFEFWHAWSWFASEAI